MNIGILNPFVTTQVTRATSTAGRVRRLINPKETYTRMIAKKTAERAQRARENEAFEKYIEKLLGLKLKLRKV